MHRTEGPRRAENPKSDVPAKKAFVAELRTQGFLNPRIAGSPADVLAEKDGATWYFEIKSTRKSDKYFGAATLNEWIQAFKDPAHFRFVVACFSSGSWSFTEYSPEAFIEHSYIPPFKVYFNVTVNADKPKKSKGVSTTVRMTEERLRQMEDLYALFKQRK